MLASTYRFHGHGSLKYVFKHGKAVRSRLMTVRYIDNPRRSVPRFSVVIGKKVVKRAVLRNRARRRVYEILRSFNSAITAPHDIVILIFSPDVIAMPHQELYEQIEILLRQAELLGE